MFAKGAWNKQVRTETYDPKLEKFFANQEISDLDTWVFDKVRMFFQNEKNNEDLRRSDKVEYESVKNNFLHRFRKTFYNFRSFCFYICLDWTQMDIQTNHIPKNLKEICK